MNYLSERDLAQIGNDIYYPHEQLDSDNYNINVGGARRNPSEKNQKQKNLITFCSKQRPFTEMNPGKQLGSIKKQIAFYEATKESPKVLRKLKFCLDCIPPSLVESERFFSAAGLFISRLKSSLSDEIIDSLCLVRSFLGNNQLFTNNMTE